MANRDVSHKSKYNLTIRPSLTLITALKIYFMCLHVRLCVVCTCKQVCTCSYTSIKISISFIHVTSNHNKIYFRTFFIYMGAKLYSLVSRHPTMPTMIKHFGNRCKKNPFFFKRHNLQTKSDCGHLSHVFVSK